MRIVYVAKHESGGNDDEGSIHHALEFLGHRVERLRECNGTKVGKLSGDFLLFHHWDDWATIGSVTIPKVAWYFDLVEWDDPTLSERNKKRIRWMNTATEVADLVLATDGDWVAGDKTGKLYWLPQGADQRIVGFGKPRVCPCCNGVWPSPPILFTGIGQGGGKERVEFVAEMHDRYGPKFNHVSKGVYREELRDLIYSSKVVVCPPSPVSDRYWSNRVWNAAGFGGLVLHPHSDQLARMYDGEIVFYRGLPGLIERIDHFLEWGEDHKVAEFKKAALDRTIKDHTYLERCKELIQVVRDRGIAK